jgi:hypothetical protein
MAGRNSECMKRLGGSDRTDSELISWANPKQARHHEISVRAVGSMWDHSGDLFCPGLFYVLALGALGLGKILRVSEHGVGSGCGWHGENGCMRDVTK